MGLSVNRIGFSQRLELRQSQALVMTPQLQQAIKMLQLSNLELADFVEAEIEQNPLLEHGERDGDDAAPPAEGEPQPPAVNGSQAALPEALSDAHEGDVAGDAAEHWRDAAGEDGDGSLDRGGDSQLWQTRNAGFQDEDARG